MGVAEFQGVMWDQPALDKFSTACGLTPALNISNQIGTDSPKKCEIPIIGMSTDNTTSTTSSLHPGRACNCNCAVLARYLEPCAFARVPLLVR